MGKLRIGRVFLRWRLTAPGCLATARCPVPAFPTPGRWTQSRRPGPTAGEGFIPSPHWCLVPTQQESRRAGGGGHGPSATVELRGAPTRETGKDLSAQRNQTVTNEGAHQPARTVASAGGVQDQVAPSADSATKMPFRKLEESRMPTRRGRRQFCSNEYF